MTANRTVSLVVEGERRRRGMSRSQLAELLGVNSVWVSRKLNGSREWSMEDLDLLSERLAIPLAALLLTPVDTLQYLPLLLVTHWYHSRVRHIWRLSHTLAA